MKALGLIDRAVAAAGGTMAFLGALAMLLMMCHVVADVSGRFLFNHPLPGTLESVTYYYMVMVTALPFAYVTRSQGQITVELFTNWMPLRWRALLEALVGVITLVYVCVFTWKTGEEAVSKYLIGEVRDAGVAQLIVWPTRWFLPLGFGVMGLAVAMRIVDDFRKFLRGRETQFAAVRGA
jgi:TRAP-type C4-dicarboxylate transport system permease small subunit